jgi:hypothetical protein
MLGKGGEPPAKDVRIAIKGASEATGKNGKKKKGAKAEANAVPYFSLFRCVTAPPSSPHPPP